MRNTSIYDLVYKVIGEINPVGDSAIDAERKENLKEMIELVERLFFDLHGVACEMFSDKESIIELSEIANNGLKEILNYYKPI